MRKLRLVKSRARAIHFAGVSVLGLSYYALDSKIESDFLLIAVVILYLCFLRIITNYFE